MMRSRGLAVGGKGVRMTKRNGQGVVSVKLSDDDAAALDVVRGYVESKAGPGVLVSQGDTVRWALHTAAGFILLEQGETQRGDQVSEVRDA